MIVENIDDFISSRSLMPIFKERKFQEEADIMALDTNENLYIFELKRWQAKEENLLQVLRYGQLFGNSSYEDLDNMYKSFTERNDISLLKIILITLV